LDRHQTLIVVPAFNEADHLVAVLAELAELAPGWPVLVVDDGSTDATPAVAREHGAEVVQHPFNLGYGAALQTGYKLARRRGVRFLVQMDADGQHQAEQISRLMAPLQDDELDLAVGNRFFLGSEYRAGALQDTGRWLLRATARLFGLHLSDPTSGFQAMNRAVIELYCGDFFPVDYPDLDVLVFARRHGLRIGERPTPMRAGPRASLLHHGFRPLYYFYRMFLALNAAAATPLGRPPRSPDR
jgi:glycosyltransferase involved in cell wall biosynthesis